MAHWHAPVDPSCPEVSDFHQSVDEDPMSQICGCLDDVYEGWERKHRIKCERCQEYGAANIEAIY